jgi:type III secretion protein J
VKRSALLLVGLPLLLAGCTTALNRGLSEEAANEELALLLRSGIPASSAYDQKSGTVTVSVAESRFVDAVDLLRAHGLPRQHYDSIPDVFKANSLVSSPAEERIRLVYAEGEELSRTISEIDGVLSARVHIVPPDDDPLRATPVPASAAVLLRYGTGLKVADLVPKIKMMVANSVEGLSYDHVSVVLVPAILPDETVSSTQAPENVAGIWVYGADALSLRIILASAIGLIVALLSLCGWLFWKLHGTSAPRFGSLIRARR